MNNREYPPRAPLRCDVSPRRKARKYRRATKLEPSNDDDRDRNESISLELTLLVIVLAAGIVSGAFAFAELL